MSGRGLDRREFTADDRARFARLAGWGGDPASDDCAEWSGARRSDGYGSFRWGGSAIGAHRFGWALANGRPLADDAVILHLCDNPPCTRPRHLRAGSHLENLADAIAKGRMGDKREELGAALIAEQRGEIAKVGVLQWQQAGARLWIGRRLDGWIAAAAIDFGGQFGAKLDGRWHVAIAGGRTGADSLPHAMRLAADGGAGALRGSAPTRGEQAERAQQLAAEQRKLERARLDPAMDRAERLAAIRAVQILRGKPKSARRRKRRARRRR